MQALHPRRARALAVALMLLVSALAMSVAAADATAARGRRSRRNFPITLVAPKAGAVVPNGSEPTFTAKTSLRTVNRRMWLTISTGKQRDRYGRLKRPNSIGTFAEMRPSGRGGKYSWIAPDYSFDTWFAVRPGKYYWQATHVVDPCRHRGCLVFSKIGSFNVG